MFSTLARGYGALQASTQPQSAPATIDRLCDRLLHADHRDDRKAALLGLKGLSRDWKADVGERALPLLLGLLDEDAAHDTELAKALVETLSLLCEVEEHDGRPVRDDSGLRNTDVFLATPTALHQLLTLLTPSHFYLRFFSLQLLGILLANRPQQVQQYVLTAAGGIGRLVETLDDSREIIRNESLLLLIALTTQNAEIQKLLAFEGAFDKLFSIVRAEGGIGSGGIVVQDCLAAIGGLLRWNVSNQNYFRETSCIPLLAPLLLFPRPNALSASSLATFAFQSWSEQKVINAGLVISLVRMLVGGAGGSGRRQNQDALLKTGLTRCLIELALASNAPAVLKSQSLNALADMMRSSPDNQSLLTSLIVTPLIPPVTPSSPETYTGGDEEGGLDPARADPAWDDGRPDLTTTNGEHPSAASASKWRRGTPVPAVVAVTALAVNGDGTPGREGLRVRAAAANLFTSYVAAGSNDTQLGILSTMSAPQPLSEQDANDDGTGSGGQQIASAGSIILRALRVFPGTGTGTSGESSSSSTTLDSYVPFFAALLFSHLICHSEVCKEAARRIYFQGDETEPGGAGDPDERASLVGILVGNLMMAQREQAHSANAGMGPERGLEWSRVMVGYLTALSVWMWESPRTVKEFLSEGSNLQVLIQPITQPSGVDSLIQGLCTFLLGICYEFNREPGPITRDTLHPILQSRVGPDQFVSRILRLREDPRFRNVGPNVLELRDDEDDTLADELGEEDGLWFDFSFVEFLKTNYVSVQRAILVDPHATTLTGRSMDGVSPEVLAALRSSLAAQTKELDELRDHIHALEAEREQERAAVEAEFGSLNDTIVALRTQLGALQEAKAEADREQEDLLVLLEEMSEKRRRDKRRLRKARVEVSEEEDEAEEEEEAEEGDDDEGDNDADAPELEQDEVREEVEDQPVSAPDVQPLAPTISVPAHLDAPEPAAGPIPADPPAPAPAPAPVVAEPVASEPAAPEAIDVVPRATESAMLEAAAEEQSEPESADQSVDPSESAAPIATEGLNGDVGPVEQDSDQAVLEAPLETADAARPASPSADVPVDPVSEETASADNSPPAVPEPPRDAEAGSFPQKPNAEVEPVTVAPPPPPSTSTSVAAAPPRASQFQSASGATRHGLPATEAIEPVIEVDERNPGPRAGVPPPPRALDGSRGLVNLRAGGGSAAAGARASPGSPRRPGTPQRPRVEPLANPFGLVAGGQPHEGEKEQTVQEDEPVVLAPPPPRAIPASQDVEAEPVEEEVVELDSASTSQPVAKVEDGTDAVGSAPAPEARAPRNSVDDRLAAAFAGGDGGAASAFSYSSPPARTSAATAASPSASTIPRDTSSLFGPPRAKKDGGSGPVHDAASLFSSASSAGGAAASSLASLFGAGAAATQSNLAAFFGGGGSPTRAPPAATVAHTASPPPQHPEKVAALPFETSTHEQSPSLFAPAPPPPKREQVASPFAPPNRQQAASPFAPPKREPVASPFAPAPASPTREQAASTFAPAPPPASSREAAASPAASATSPPRDSLFSSQGGRNGNLFAGGPSITQAPTSPLSASASASASSPSPFALTQAKDTSSLFGGPPPSKQDALAFFAAPHQQQHQAANGGTGGAPFGLRPANPATLAGFGTDSGASDAARDDSASIFGPRDASLFGAPLSSPPPPQQQQQQRREEPHAFAARDVSSLFG